MNLIFEPSDHARYLEGLNECFPGWGNEKMYAWCFARLATGPAPERFVFTNEVGDWVAGTAISFRTIRANGKRWISGVMTGSWTLPAARGKGLFPQFIQETRKRVAHHGGVAVLGFAGDVQRASTRKLKDAGSRCVPSMNGIGEVANAPKESSVKLDVMPIAKTDAEMLYARFQARHERAGGFVYDDLASFTGQFVERAQAIDLAHTDGDALVVLERGPDTDRVLFMDEGRADRATLYRALWHRAGTKGRKLYAYGVGDAEASAFAAAGLAPRAGFFTILPADDSPEHAAICDDLTKVTWDYQSGDRM